MKKQGGEVFLSTPGNFRPDKMRMSCGNLMIELMLFLNGSIDGLQGSPIDVESKILGGMLPWDIKKSLSVLGIESGIKSLTGETDEKRIEFLKTNLRKGVSPILLVGKGAGHQLALWGFDECQFFCFDSSKGVERDSDGLTSYSYEELLRVWGHSVWPLQIVKGIYSVLPRFRERLQCEPYNAVICTQSIMSKE